MNLRLFGKTPLYYVLFILLAAAAFFYVNHATVVVEDGAHIDSNMAFEKHDKPKNVGTNQSFNSDSQVNEAASSIEEIVWKSTPEQIAELAKWQASRGWYDTSNANQDDYKSYSRDALKQLADNGDLNALHLLNKGTPVPEKKELLTKAAIYGSTYAIAILKDIEISTHNLTDQSSDEDRKEAVISGAVYPFLAQMRGDLEILPERELPKLEKEYSVQLNNADRKLIAEKAAKLYAELESQREQLGLGKFDNSIPPIAQAYYKSRGLLK